MRPCRRAQANSGSSRPKGTVARASAQHRALGDAVARCEGGRCDASLRLASTPALQGTALAGYASYYAGLSQLKLSQTAEARRTFENLLGTKLSGYLAIATALAAGEAAEAAGDHAAAVRMCAPLAANKLAVTDDVLARLGRAAIAAGERRQALKRSFGCITSSR